VAAANQKESDMNKSEMMKNFLLKHGGEYLRKDGRWHWKKSKDSNDTHLVTINFLIHYKPTEETVVKEEPKIEVKEEPKVEVKEEQKKEVKKSKPKKKPEIVNNVEEAKQENNSEQL